MPVGILALALALAFASTANAAPTKPKAGISYYNGPSGQYTLGGAWYVQRDPLNAGLKQRLQRSKSFDAAKGWSAITVPHSFNAGNFTEQSYTGGVAWYGTEFTLPRSARGTTWILRFDSVNFYVRVYLNGRQIGSHSGGYVPFEVEAKSMRRGTNRLVLRVDSRLHETTVPSQELRNDTLTGGWWNYGGVLREVILRRARRVDIASVATRSKISRKRGPAKIKVLARVKNYSGRRIRLRLHGTFGRQRISFKPVRLKRGGSAELVGTLTVKRPKLWEPGAPRLYRVRVSGGGASYRLRAGIRRLAVSRRGTLSVNFKKTRFRGISFHESDTKVGAAWSAVERNANLALITQLGANMIRSHYPLSPQIMEWADRNGIFVWNQAPVFRPRKTQLKTKRYRRNAVSYTKQMVLANRAHPSVLVWSLMNEAVPSGTTNLNRVISAQRSAALKLDPDGLVGADYAAAPEDELQHPAYRKLDVLGINQYFGWYPGLLGSTLDINKLAPYLAYLHRAYAHQAMFVTEFGAEANRNGPADELGTFEFQTNYMLAQMRTLRGIPFLNGYFAWALKDYAVRPDWGGGNPDPSPPYSKKGLFDENGNPKPAAIEVEREFKATPPFR